MCGLIALADTERPLDARSLEPSLEVLRQRGPDARGCYVSPDRKVALGHTRLAIVDLSAGPQPLSNTEGSVWAMLNGELYEAASLRRELSARGAVFQTACDAELLVHLYVECRDDDSEQGLRPLVELRGEYAFVLYDAERRVLVAGRDPDGVRPLYRAQHRGRLVFGSSVKALFAAGVPAAWDEEGLQLAAAIQYPSPGRSLFRGVDLLPAGALVVVQLGDARGGAPPRGRLVRAKPLGAMEGVLGGVLGGLGLEAGAGSAAAARDAADARLLAALFEAVQLRIPDEVPYACALSGGIDSSAIVALVRAISGRPPPVFTVRFEDDALDEFARARATASELGCEHHELRLDGRAVATHLPAAVRAAEGSAINVHLVGKWALARAVRVAGYKVLLSGEGADEVLLGYPHFMLDAGQAATDYPAQRALAGLMLPSGPTRNHDLPHFLQAKLQLGQRIHALSTFPSFEESAGRALRLAAVAANERRGGSPRDPVDMASSLWRVLAFERYILHTLADGVELAFGVEGRPPFLDRAVQAAARAISIQDSIDAGIEKAALRRVMRGLVPDAILRAPKQPFVGPTMLLSERGTDLYDLATATLCGPRAPAFVDRKAVAARLDASRGAGDVERRLWDPPLMWLLTMSLLEDALLR